MAKSSQKKQTQNILGYNSRQHDTHIGAHITLGDEAATIFRNVEKVSEKLQKRQEYTDVDRMTF